MSSFVIDPFLSTVPDGSDRATMLDWFASLEQWLLEVEISPFPWGHFLECTYKLIENNCFPTFAVLREIIRKNGFDINAAFLSRKINLFFQNEQKSISSLTMTQFVVTEDGESNIIPKELYSRNHSEVQPILHNSLLCMACDQVIGESFADSAHIVTMPLKDLSRKLNVSATISLTDPDGISLRLGPHEIRATFPLLFSPKDLSDTINIEGILEIGSQALEAIVRYRTQPSVDESIIVLALVPESKASAALADGASHAGITEVINIIKSQTMKYDFVVVSPDVECHLAEVSDILIDNDQMPTRESGQISDDICRSIQSCRLRYALPFSLNREFYSSIIAGGIATDHSAFQKLIRILCSIVKNKILDMNIDLRPLRVSKAADSKQRIRATDKASAWRLTITDGGVGWRMHYWHIPMMANGQVEAIEFANILKKHDPEIIPE